MKTITHNLKKSVAMLFVEATIMSAAFLLADKVKFTLRTTHSASDWETTGLQASCVEYIAIADKSLITKITKIPANGISQINNVDLTNIKTDFPNLTALDLSGVLNTGVLFPQVFGTGANNATTESEDQ